MQCLCLVIFAALLSVSWKCYCSVISVNTSTLYTLKSIPSHSLYLPISALIFTFNKGWAIYIKYSHSNCAGSSTLSLPYSHKRLAFACKTWRKLNEIGGQLYFNDFTITRNTFAFSWQSIALPWETLCLLAKAGIV